MRQVLLNGYLDSIRLKRAQNKIEKVFREGKGVVVLVVESDGGDVPRTIDFISRLKTLEEKGAKVVLKVKIARSAAALLVLSVGSLRLMDRTGSIHLHRGSLLLEAADFNHETGQISEEILCSVKQYDILLKNILEKYGLAKNERMMAELYGSGWLSLRANTCHRSGLVDRLL
jgi:hypothetical protein